jgi:hypothetical protein
MAYKHCANFIADAICLLPHLVKGLMGRTTCTAFHRHNNPKNWVEQNAYASKTKRHKCKPHKNGVDSEILTYATGNTGNNFICAAS